MHFNGPERFPPALEVSISGARVVARYIWRRQTQNMGASGPRYSRPPLVYNPQLSTWGVY